MSMIPLVIPMAVPLPSVGGSAGVELDFTIYLDTPKGHHWQIEYVAYTVFPWQRQVRVRLWRGNDIIGHWDVKASQKAIQREARRQVARYIKTLKALE